MTTVHSDRSGERPRALEAHPRRPSARPIGAPGPLLVVGPPRSSQTLVALALAQHRHCELVLDSSWLPRLGEAVVGVHRTATHLGDRSAVGATATAGDFAAAAGTAAATLLAPDVAWTLGRPARTWVSSIAVERRRDAVLLAEMFPDARFVHVVRHPDSVVHSLATRACGDGRYLHRNTAYRAWCTATDALLDVERAYGADRVVRTTADELHTDPAAALTRCLGLVGLRLDPMCVAAVKAVTPDTDAAAGDESGRGQALARYEQLTGPVPTAGGTGDLGLRAALWDDVVAGSPERSTVDDGPARYRQFVQLSVPEHATVAVISKGDPTLLEVPGRTCVHLSRTATGQYVGYHPAGDAEAVDRLRRAIADGVEYLVVPGASRWWLEHYPALDELLRRTARTVAHHEDIATTYDLPTDIPHA